MREGGGAAFAIELPTTETFRLKAEATAFHKFSERFECRPCGIQYRGPAAAPVLVQQPVRRLSGLPRLRQRHRARHGAGRAGSDEVDPAERHRAVEQAALPRAARRLEARGAGARRADRRPVERADRRGETVRHRRRPFGRLRAGPSTGSGQAPSTGSGQAGYEGVKGFFRWLERKKYKVHVRVFLSRYRGYLTCPECNGARLRREARDVRVGDRTIDAVAALTVRDARALLRRAGAVGKGNRDRREGAGGDSPPAWVSSRRRPRLPDARPAVVDALGRRIAAHQPRDLARLRARRHPVRARRAVDRPAFARQRTADRHPASAPRPGEYRARRRTRRRHDQGRRQGRRHGPRRRRAGRPRDLQRDAPGAAQRTAFADREISARRAGDPGAGDPAEADRTEDSRSSTPPSTTSKAWTSRSRSACSRASPASAAPARARWCTTSSTPR